MRASCEGWDVRLVVMQVGGREFKLMGKLDVGPMTAAGRGSGLGVVMLRGWCTM